MPIYSYRCEHCGHRQDVLQKLSDPLLVTCPICGEPTFRKQVTAAGFQLKGSGWYVTDFKNPPAKEATKSSKPDADAAGTKSDAPAIESSSPATETAAGKSAPSGESKSGVKSESKSESKSEAASPKPPPATTGEST